MELIITWLLRLCLVLETNLGMDFDSKADIFSWGVIGAELLAWKVSDGVQFMKRVIPGFGFDEADIRKYDNEITPPPYIDMILKCVEPDAQKRITMKEVLQILKEIEMILQVSKNVGTIFIAKTNLDSLDSSPVIEEDVRPIRGNLVNSDVFPESKYPSLQRVNQASVISHNIPHRFSIHKIPSLAKKCELCEKHIYFKHLECDECGCSCHMECGIHMPSFCGLSKSLQTLVSPAKSMHSAESLLSPNVHNAPMGLAGKP